MKNLRTIIATRVKISRLSMGLTQDQLAVKSKVHRTGICHIENGRYLPKVAKLLRIAITLNVTLDYLVGRDY